MEEEDIIINPNRHHSEDSIEGFEEEEKHHHLPLNHQMFLQSYNFNNSNHLMGARFSVDDGGMDEYDVADERQHIYEMINPDNMSYEELLALQERIGFVNKGLSKERLMSFPKMLKKDILKFLSRKKENISGRKKVRNEEDCEDYFEDDFVNREVPNNYIFGHY